MSGFATKLLCWGMICLSWASEDWRRGDSNSFQHS